jgi:hypothetical protein
VDARIDRVAVARRQNQSAQCEKGEQERAESLHWIIEVGLRPRGKNGEGLFAGTIASLTAQPGGLFQKGFSARFAVGGARRRKDR